jgi:hypothetical protein
MVLYLKLIIVSAVVILVVLSLVLAQAPSPGAVFAATPTPTFNLSGRIVITPGLPITVPPLTLDPDFLTRDPLVNVVITLEETPVVQVYLAALGRGESAAIAQAAANAQRRRIKRAQDALIAILTGSEFGAQLLGRTQMGFNLVMVRTNRDNIAQIRQLPGVVSVMIDVPMVLHPIEPGTPDR